MFFFQKLQFLVFLLVALHPVQSFLMVHSQDVEMQNRYYFPVILNGVDMLKRPQFRPDIPITHQWLVLTDPDYNLDDYSVGDVVELTWFAILPKSYSFHIINLHLYATTSKNNSGKPVENPLIPPNERMSFRKHLSVVPESQEQLDNLKFVLRYAFTDIRNYQKFRERQGSTIELLESDYRSINDEDLIGEYPGKTNQEKRANWENAVLDAEDDLNAEIGRVNIEIMEWLLTNGRANMNLVGTYDFLSEEIYGPEPKYRVYFHTRTFNVVADDVESKGIDKTHNVITRRAWFEFSLEFPGALELKYMEYYKSAQSKDSDVLKYEEFMREFNQTLGRRQMIV